jgi:hypothetical protein
MGAVAAVAILRCCLVKGVYLACTGRREGFFRFLIALTEILNPATSVTPDNSQIDTDQDGMPSYVCNNSPVPDQLVLSHRCAVCDVAVAYDDGRAQRLKILGVKT